MAETDLLKRCQVALVAAGAKVFRNNCGKLRAPDGHVVTFGVANPGGSDLIGWYPITVTPSMVGHKLAVFLACEVKGPDGQVTAQQRQFLETVRKAGGFATVARSVDDATGTVTTDPANDR